MRRLTRAEVLALQPSDTPYYVRLARLAEDTEVEIWRGRTALYVERAPAILNVPERLAVVAPRALDWAEGGWRDVAGDGRVIVEDYAMEVFALEVDEERG